jgi:hypothetical protein
MKTHRLWVEIVILGTVIACALALLIATLGAAAGAAVGEAGPPQPQNIRAQATRAQATQAGPEQSYQGMVTCSRCGAKHSAAFGRAAADCVRICVHAGAGFSLVDGDETYLLDGDPNALKRVAGQRARVVGAINGKTIKVFSIAAS